MSDTLSCWQCGALIAADDLPVTRRSTCRQCGVDLHVCRLCRHYAPRLSRKCDEDQAEPARAVDVANFCEWFSASPAAYHAADAHGEAQARAELAALFGDEGETPAVAADDDPAAKLAALLKAAEKKD